MTKREKKQSLNELLRQSKTRVDAMSGDELEAMLAEQRKSWVRAMAPCEHGVRDWETCPDCRSAAAQSSKDGAMS